MSNRALLRARGGKGRRRREERKAHGRACAGASRAAGTGQAVRLPPSRGAPRPPRSPTAVDIPPPPPGAPPAGPAAPPPRGWGLPGGWRRLAHFPQPERGGRAPPPPPRLRLWPLPLAPPRGRGASPPSRCRAAPPGATRRPRRRAPPAARRRAVRPRGSALGTRCGPRPLQLQLWQERPQRRRPSRRPRRRRFRQRHNSRGSARSCTADAAALGEAAALVTPTSRWKSSRTPQSYQRSSPSWYTVRTSYWKPILRRPWRLPAQWPRRLRTARLPCPPPRTTAATLRWQHNGPSLQTHGTPLPTPFLPERARYGAPPPLFSFSFWQIKRRCSASTWRIKAHKWSGPQRYVVQRGGTEQQS